MFLFILISALTLGGIAFVFISLNNEGEEDQGNQGPNSGLLHKIGLGHKPPPLTDFPEDSNENLPSNPSENLEIQESGPFEPKQDEPPKSPFAKFLSNLRLDKFKFGNILSKNESLPESTPLPSLKDFLESEKKAKGSANIEDNMPFGTASMRTIPINENAPSDDLPQASEDQQPSSTEPSRPETDSSEKLQKMLEEKNTELEKIQNALDAERKNRIEFEKIRKILEGEATALKERLQVAESKLSSGSADTDNQNKIKADLENKVSALEKSLAEKDQEIDKLIKRLQTFASPSTADTPPKKEQSQATPQKTTNEKQETQSATPDNAPPPSEAKPNNRLKLQPDPTEEIKANVFKETTEPTSSPPVEEQMKKNLGSIHTSEEQQPQQKIPPTAEENKNQPKNNSESDDNNSEKKEE